LIFLLGLSLAVPAPVRADTAHTDNDGELLTINVNQQDIQLQHYPAEGRYVTLWLAPGSGFGPRHHQVASALQQQGIESWQVDLLENLFLPRGSASIRKVDAELIAALVQRVRQQTNKKLVLVSNSYGAIPLLRGMRQWQLDQQQDDYLIGAVLFSPNAYQGIPSLGLPPEYIPSVFATNMPLMIIQSAANGNRWQLPQLIDALQSGGSPVFWRLMPGVTSMFYDKEDKADATLQHLQQTPGRIVQAIQLLDKLPHPPHAAELPGSTMVKTKPLGLNITLTPFRADWSPPPIRLEDANGTKHVIQDYTGKVRVINFWASWCPPCVEEIPSLNRLREQLADQSFELISVNYAQQAEEVKAFLREVEVNFPVLIDRRGAEAARWQVLAFPSTFVIDAQGKIRYGVNAAIEWDNPEVVSLLRRLIQESK